MINGDVPAGLSDDDVKSYVRMKRPDLFGAPPAGIKIPTPSMEKMSNGTDSMILPAHGAGGLGPGQPEATPGMGTAGGAGLALGAGVASVPAALSFLAAGARAHPMAAAIVGQELIHQARQIPMVGKHIPAFAELLPLLYGGRGKAVEPEAEAASEVQQSQTLGKIPTRSPLPQQLRPNTPQEPSQNQSPWPPPEPTGVYDQPVKSPTGREDVMDDQAVREQVQDRVNQSDRKWQAQQGRRDWAANTVNQTKGELVQNAGGTIPQKPVKFTKTPGVKVSGPLGTQAPATTDDLTPILQKMLDLARAAKKTPPS
jgi:hypothetical protein